MIIQDTAAKRNAIPVPVVRRLAKYLGHVQEMEAEGQKWISSRQMAWSLGLTSSTVRQDLTHLAAHGIAKRGYRVDVLRSQLRDVLGIGAPWNVAIIGAGNVGCSLAAHADLRGATFNVVAIFDNDPRVVGKRVGTLSVRSMRALPRLVAELRIDIGILAVPSSSAQRAADHLVMARVPGILNLASAFLKVSSRTALVNSRLIEYLLELSHMIQAKRACGTGRSAPPVGASKKR